MEEKVANINELQDGEMMTVVVGEQPVLLAKVNGQFYATGAKCPHYGGPLPEGTLYQARVMCPLHQATFNVKTGDLLEPPALDGVPRFDVRIDGEDVYVNVPEGVPEQRTMPMSTYEPDQDTRTFVVIGGGAGAATAVETLRQVGFRGRLVMISAEDRWPYDRPNCSKGYLSGRAEAAHLPLRSPEFYAQYGIERLHQRVISFDVPSRTLTLSDGSSLTPDAVLIATGAAARKLDLPGAQLERVFTLRSWDDCDAIIAATRGAKQAVVIGASFIGMETASALRRRGLSVTVVAPGSVPFQRLLGEEVGGWIQKIQEANGTTFKLGRRVRQFLGDGSVSHVELDDGTTLPADLVVVGIGVQPATDFIKGVKRNEDGSVDVDEQFRLAERVWAIGDIARFPEFHSGQKARIEHWRMAEQHGRAAARSMAGQGEPFRGVPFFWTRFFDAGINYVGYAIDWDEVVIAGSLEERDFVAYYAKGNRLLAAAGWPGSRLGPFAALMQAGQLPPADALRGKKSTALAELLKQMKP